MFGLFLDNILKDFWANAEGDIFLEATAKGLRLNKDLIDLNFYPEIYETPKFYEFDENKNLIVKKEIVTINEVVTQNENGDDVTTQEEVKSYEVDKIIEPIVYFSKGLMIKLC
jgi:hypothetical protein